jgi:hypothetical protein
MYFSSERKKIITVALIIIAIFFISCSKEEKNGTDKQIKKEQLEVQEQTDTNLTPEEKFSTSILGDFLDNSEDEDLAYYLEEELFKYSHDYRGASIVPLSQSIWFVTLEKQNTTKNYLLQKFVDFTTNDYYFLLKETNLTITDIASKIQPQIQKQTEQPQESKK